MTDANKIAELAEVARAIQFAPFDSMCGMPFVVVPTGYKVESLESLMGAPGRVRGKVTFTEPDGWMPYVGRFKTSGTLIMASTDAAGAEFLARLDYHEDAYKPHWGSHEALLRLAFSRQLQLWKTQMDGKWVTQEVFAEFLEENALDLAGEVAGLLEICLQLKVTKGIECESGVNPKTGGGFIRYSETVNTTTKGSGDAVEVPPMFQLGVPVFERGEKYEITCRIRYRLENKRLQLRCDIVRLQDIIDDAVAQIREKIHATTGILPHYGKLT